MRHELIREVAMCSEARDVYEMRYKTRQNAKRVSRLSVGIGAKSTDSKILET
jgi:hypothetical protein